MVTYGQVFLMIELIVSACPLEHVFWADITNSQGN